MKRALGTLAGAAMLASVVLTGGTANAATGWNRCPAEHLCLFDGANGTGGMAWFKTGSPNLAGQGMDNKTSSVWNRSPNWFDAYDLRNCNTDGARWTLVGYGVQFNLDAAANNRYSSVSAWNIGPC